MKSWDAIVIGAGIIGLSLAIELRKAGMSVLIVERGEPGREASGAAGGMLADCGLEIPAPLYPLATASARMYPEVPRVNAMILAGSRGLAKACDTRLAEASVPSPLFVPIQLY